MPPSPLRTILLTSVVACAPGAASAADVVVPVEARTGTVPGVLGAAAVGPLATGVLTGVPLLSAPSLSGSMSAPAPVLSAPASVASVGLPASAVAAAATAVPAKAAALPAAAGTQGSPVVAAQASGPAGEVAVAAMLDAAAQAGPRSAGHGRALDGSAFFDGAKPNAIAMSKSARRAPQAGELDGLVVAERRALKGWGTLDAAGKARVAAELVDRAQADLTATGYTVRRVPSAHGERLLIDAMPGRQGVFLRRLRARGDDQIPALVYDPAELGERDGSGAQFDGVTNSLELDAASLAVTHTGSLGVLKHELRHGRQAAILRSGKVNADHGWFSFAEAAPRRELSGYENDFQIDEILVYSKQQQDTAGDLRRIMARIEREGNGFLKQPAERAMLGSALHQVGTNYYGTVNMARAFQESADAIAAGFRAGPAVAEPLEGNAAHFYRGVDGSDALVIEFFVNERLGPHGLMGIQFRASRRGKPVKDADGDPAMDFLAIPVPKGEQARYESNPAAAKTYVLEHLARAGREIRARRDGVVSRQQEIRDLADRVSHAAVR